MKVLSVFAALVATAAAVIQVGEKVPNAELHFGFPPEKIDLSSRIAGRNVILLSLPGAFTPTWSGVQVPGYLEAKDELKALGVQEVIVFCVNDGAVMNAWARDQGVPNGRDDLITFMGDPWSSLGKSLDIEMHADGPQEVGLVKRSKRAAIYVEDGIAKIVRVAESEDDPAGDNHPDVTLAGAMVTGIKELYPFADGEL